ncbi:MAG TPA: cyclic nucleotide-binding domain-containing protein [Actinomycetota bacterium]|nr:cyclic nucleotide-binding domain-containing protein [Actinomycetota bacterium]
MRIESSVTAVSWVPLDCVEGGQRLAFHVGAAQYDDPPPQQLEDLPSLLAEGRVRFANQLRGYAEVSDGRIVASGQSGRGYVGASREAADANQVGFAAVPLPDLRPDPETGEGWVRFGQTAGGLLSVGMPYRTGPATSPRLAAPAAWTTLSLTIHADGTSAQALAGASPFPRHWVYDHDGRLVATSGVVDFTGWQADAWDPFTPWGGRDAPVRATAVETALERELSQVMLDSAPQWIRLRKGATLVSQGDPGHELYLLLDGLLAVEIDGRTVTELGPGAVVGEVALLEGGRRTATLRAVTPCRVAAVPGDRIDRDALAELARTRGWPGPGAGRDPA